jgi:hypothetical protein
MGQDYKDAFLIGEVNDARQTRMLFFRLILVTASAYRRLRNRDSTYWLSQRAGHYDKLRRCYIWDHIDPT